MTLGSSNSEWQPLRFQPWQSAPDVSFWQKLASLKLNKFHLSDQPQDVVGYFTPGRSPTVPSRLTVDDSAFLLSESTITLPVDRTRYEWKAPGVLYNTNTLEDFKSLNKNEVLQNAGKRLMSIITDNSLSNGWDRLNSFVLITFADLKKHSFLYWFGFVTAATTTPMMSRPPVAASTILSFQEQRHVMQGLMGLRTTSEAVPLSNFPPFFVIQRTLMDGIRVHSLETWLQQPPLSPEDSTELLFGFVDPCPLQSNPGWPLRNYLVLLSSLLNDKLQRDRPLSILSFREHIRQTSELNDVMTWTSSLVFHVKTGNDFVLERESIKFLGWEANARGKMGPRLMELGALLDPIRLAEQSVDLNLKLMLWRQLPSLQLDRLATTKCLVLGAGTLGCFTARSLLSWGFRNITMVDNSVVSHSNPVRQPLFEFNDVGKPKAASAADSLKRIFPLVNATAVQLSIPMAGHALSNESLVKEAYEAFETLTELIDNHDVVFLGTDSRESRWLPTVMCAVRGKLLLNSALGFDSYLVMRHGTGTSVDTRPSLGCYFCNDVVSPRDSLKDRTLDQMCTVTRPGLAPIAAATAVELLVAVLHSPDGVHTSAVEPKDMSSSLSFVPHQLRGFLNSFATMVITGEAFDKCIACSGNVQEAYQADAFALLQNACNSVTYLEELTGLHTLTQAADSFIEEMELSDEDSLL